jgi:DNA-binding Lrp family transcriptional regulator
MPNNLPRTWSFFTNHALVLICIADDPDTRLREIGDTVGITERAAHRIVNELVGAGYVIRERVGRRNRYAIQSPPRLSDPPTPEPRIGELLTGDLLALLHRRSPRVASAAQSG